MDHARRAGIQSNRIERVLERRQGPADGRDAPRTPLGARAHHDRESGGWWSRRTRHRRAREAPSRPPRRGRRAHARFTTSARVHRAQARRRAQGSIHGQRAHDGGVRRSGSLRRDAPSAPRGEGIHPRHRGSGRGAASHHGGQRRPRACKDGLGEDHRVPPPRAGETQADPARAPRRHLGAGALPDPRAGVADRGGVP